MGGAVRDLLRRLQNLLNEIIRHTLPRIECGHWHGPKENLFRTLDSILSRLVKEMEGLLEARAGRMPPPPRSAAGSSVGQNAFVPVAPESAPNTGPLGSALHSTQSVCDVGGGSSASANMGSVGRQRLFVSIAPAPQANAGLGDGTLHSDESMYNAGEGDTGGAATVDMSRHPKFVPINPAPPNPDPFAGAPYTDQQVFDVGEGGSEPRESRMPSGISPMTTSHKSPLDEVLELSPQAYADFRELGLLEGVHVKIVEEKSGHASGGQHNRPIDKKTKVKMSAPNQGRQSPDPERQGKAQIHEPPASNVNDQGQSAEQSKDALKNLESNPKGAMDAAAEEKTKKTMDPKA